MHYFQIISLSVIITSFSTLCQAEVFPYRKDYPDVPTIELVDLKKGYDSGEFVVIDVRSQLEYDTIHIKNAFHIPMANAHFEKNVKALAGKGSNKKIAMYCNGITCLKSYKSAERSMEAGLSNVYAFDAGIPAWANAYPSETLLLGKEITDPGKQLISKSEFIKVSLDFEMFKQRASDTNSIIIDVRDAIQRTQALPGLKDVKPIPLDKFIKNIVNRGMMKDHSLLIFDQVGKQVRWLMYHLVNQGYTEFYFLKGGATSVLKEQEYR